jgi:hypothetical protein
VSCNACDVERLIWCQTPRSLTERSRTHPNRVGRVRDDERRSETAREGVLCGLLCTLCFVLAYTVCSRVDTHARAHTSWRCAYNRTSRRCWSARRAVARPGVSRVCVDVRCDQSNLRDVWRSAVQHLAALMHRPLVVVNLNQVCALCVYCVALLHGVPV